MLLNHDDGDDEDALAIYDSVVEWSIRRNSVLHELAELLEDEDKIWPDRYEEARLTAVRGETLVRRVSALVKKLNLPNSAAKKLKSSRHAN